MQAADRRFTQLMFGAWCVIYVWMLIQIFSDEALVGAHWLMVPLVILIMGLFSAFFTAITVCIPLRIIFNLALKERHRSHRSETIALGLLLGLIVAYLVEVERERDNLAPPVGVTTMSAFADRMPPPQRLQLIEMNGRDYLAWTGELSGPFDVPSGPSCYLFDSSGRLIDWQPETGDGGPVEAFLGSSEQRKQLTLDEALKMSRSARSTN